MVSKTMYFSQKHVFFSRRQKDMKDAFSIFKIKLYDIFFT